MGIIRFAIENPVKVTVGVLLLVLFGLLSISYIPVQLTPNVDRPIVTVTTWWEGASPQEIEREITERQEEKLKGANNLLEMTSSSIEGQSEIVLEFHVGVDKDAALRDVSDKLRQVSGYPDDVDEPTIKAADAALDAPIAWLIFFAAQGENPSTMSDFVEDEVKPILERAEGVAEVNVYGGREREIQIRIDAASMAARKISLRDVENALRLQNKNISAGTITSGKRDTTWRTIGQYETIDQILDTVVAYYQDVPVYVRDIASVHNTFKKQRSFVRSIGENVLALPVRRETGSNVIEVMTNLKTQIKKVNDEILSPLNRELLLTQVYDETVYIHSAIDLVKKNLVIGGILAVIVLILFLRSPSATGIVALCIPISVVGSFLVVTVLGRTLNVIMLAGMAFAVGMVVDNSIVVLENIYRHQQLGKSRWQAALDGAVEVWGAVLASTLTTLAVFLPVVTIQEEAGQLFRDIAIAICAAVGLSLIVAMTVIPTVSARMLRAGKSQATDQSHHRIANGLAKLIYQINSRWISRLVICVVLVASSLLGSYLLRAPADYLPAGNRNLVFGVLITPPGYSLDEFRRMGEIIEEDISPYWDTRLAHKNTPEGQAQAQELKNTLDERWQSKVAQRYESMLTDAEKHLAEVRAKHHNRKSGYFEKESRAFAQLREAEDALATAQQQLAQHQKPPTMIGTTLSTLQAASPSQNDNLAPAPEVQRFHKALNDAQNQLEKLKKQYSASGSAEFKKGADAFQELNNAEASVSQTRETLRSYKVSPPAVENFFYVSFLGQCFMGATSRDDEVVRPVVNLLSEAGQRIPGTYAFFSQASLFNLGGAGNSIELQIRGADLNQVVDITQALSMNIMQYFGFAQPNPGNYDLGRPEVQIIPDRIRAAEVGLNVRDVGQIVETCVDGAFVPGGFRQRGDEIDIAILVKGLKGANPEKIAQVPIATPLGGVIPLGSVVDIIRTTAPQQINHIEELPAITLNINPPENMPLEQATSILQDKIIRPMREEGRIPNDIFTVTAGNAAKLDQTRSAMFGEWSGKNWESVVRLVTSRGFLALLITFLLMAALFESFSYPFVIMFSVIPATVGGFAGLNIVHAISAADPLVPTQNLDVLTMLGFVILVGVVVNNAILLVHQALNNMRDHRMAPQEAISESVRTRVRPIFMTAMTSVCGMLPLVFMPGPGRELYRGLGSVVVGGLLVSTIFTLVLVPALFSIFVDLQQKVFGATPGACRPLEETLHGPTGSVS